LACKATYVEINGRPKNIFKSPKTGDGLKKSAKGLLSVQNDFTLLQECTPEQENEGLLTTVFENGVLVKDFTFSEIRDKLNKYGLRW